MNRDTPEFAAFLSVELTPRNRGRLELILYYHFGLAQKAEIAALLDLILENDHRAAARITASGTDACYLAALTALATNARLGDGAGVLQQHNRLQGIDERHDFIHANRDQRDWSLIRCINFLYRWNTRPARKIAIVTSIRNEGINLLEWIAHHRALGVDDFIIYANDNDDGSSDLLTLLARHGIIHLIWNRVDLPKDGSVDMFPIQAKAFGHATEFLAESLDFEWLLFIDVDEFLVTRPVLEAPLTARPLDDLFARVAAMPAVPAAIAFNWKFFTSEGQFRRAPGLNFERFTQACGDHHVKTCVRSRHCTSFHTSHMPRLIPGDIVLNGALEPVAEYSFQMPVTFVHGQINHYFSKSFEEFVAKHLRVWGEKRLSEFFTVADNLLRKPEEPVPPAWIARVNDEIARLQNLPGVPPESEKIEAAYAALLARFDRQYGIEAQYRRWLPQ